MIDNILNSIKKAMREAEKQNIRANAIIISPEYHYIREHIAYQNSLMPPMLCGMKAYIDNGELPEEYAFAIVDSDPPERPMTRAEVIEELRSLSVDDLIKVVYGVNIKEDQP